MASRTALLSIPDIENEMTKATMKPPALSIVARRPVLENIANTDDKLAKRKLKGSESTGDSNKEAQKPVKSEALPTAANPVNSLTTAFSSNMITIPDVDSEDSGNPQLVSIYINEIYDYLRELEKKSCIKQNFLKGHEVTGRMRAILLDWLVQVASRFQLLPETFYLTVDIIDRFLQVLEIPKPKLQLVGVTAMFIASKYEEMYAPPIGDFVYITDKAYTALEVRKMEVYILKTLNFNLGRPLPLHFLRRNSKVGEVDGLTHNLAKYLMELAVVEYDMAHYAPSLLAASALCFSLKILYNLPWNSTLAHYSKYEEKELKPVMSKLARIVIKSEMQKLQAVREKFASVKYMKISRIPELKSGKVREIAYAL